MSGYTPEGHEQPHDPMVKLATEILSRKAPEKEGVRIAKGFVLNDGAEAWVRENPGENIVIVAFDRNAMYDSKRHEKGRNINEIWTFDVTTSAWSSEPDSPKRKLEEVLKEISQE